MTEPPCRQHRQYKAKRRPIGICAECWAAWLHASKDDVAVLISKAKTRGEVTGYAWRLSEEPTK